MRNLFNQNPSSILSSSTLSAVIGGKRAASAFRSAELTLITKAEMKVDRRLGRQSGSIDFKFNNQSYTAIYSAEENMLHVVSADGTDICVEW
jgi:hypothetical protein